MLRIGTERTTSGRCVIWAVLGLAFTWCGLVNGQSLAELQAAAKKRDPSAQYQLGRRYLLGIGTPVDEKEGFKLVKDAADKGNIVEAIHLVAICYATEAGVKKSEAQAAKYLDKAASVGLAEAQFKLGTSYETGLLGLKADPAIAMKWYLAAAKQGHPRAQYKYAGLIHSTDYNISAEWYRKAADQGVVEAQIRVGDLYSIGQAPGGRDFAEAYKWYLIASRLSHSEAVKKLEQANNRSTYYTDAVVAEGRRRAEAYLQKHQQLSKAQ